MEQPENAAVKVRDFDDKSPPRPKHAMPIREHVDRHPASEVVDRMRREDLAYGAVRQAEITHVREDIRHAPAA
jgi:hypothetical protein